MSLSTGKNIPKHVYYRWKYPAIILQLYFTSNFVSIYNFKVEQELNKQLLLYSLRALLINDLFFKRVKFL